MKARCMKALLCQQKVVVLAPTAISNVIILIWEMRVARGQRQKA